MRRLLRTTILLLFASSFVAGGVLLGTEPGLQWSVRQLENLGNGAITIGAAEGYLLGEIRLRDLHYRDARNELRIDRLALSWQPTALLQRQVRITALDAAGLSITQKAKQKPSRPFQGFSLPLTIRLEQATITDIHFQREEGKPLMLHEIRLGGSFRKQNLSLRRLTLSAPQGELQLEGHVETSAELPFAIDSRWHWNAPSDSPFGASGTLRLDGTPQHYRFEATARLPSERFPPAKMELGGTGDLSGLRVEKLLARWLHGEWNGSGNLKWRPALHWEASLSARSIDPALAWKKWPGGRISLDVTGQGNGKTIRVALQRLRGKVQEYPLAASGGFQFADGVLRFEKLRITSGSARFTASGSVGETWSAAWHLSAPQLAHLWPDLAGELEASGRIGGARKTPNLQVRLEGNAIRWNDRAAQRLQGDLKLGLRKDEPWSLDLRIDDIRIGKNRLQRLALTGDGFIHDHRLQLQLVRDETIRFSSEIHGELKEGVWHALLENGELVLPKLRWRQHQSAQLRLGKSKASLSPWCWEHRQARLCLQGGRTADSGWQADLSLEHLQLAWLHPWLPREDLSLTGVAEGSAHLTYRQGRLDGSRVELYLRRGKAGYTLPEEERYEIAYREIALEMEKRPDALTFSLAGDLLKTGHLRGDWRLPGWHLSAARAKEQPLQGNLALRLEDLSLLALLTHRIQHPKGRIEGDLAFGGSVGEPRLEGQVRLDEGSLTLPDLGITLQGIALRLEPRQGSKLALRGTARSGPGALELAGELDLSSLQEWRGWISVKGKNVEVARLPEAKVIASPDLMVRIQPRFIQLAGYVEVPKAKIRLPEKQGLVPVSPDVVIVGGEEETPRKRWRIATTIALKLGEKVKVSGHGFEGRISGQLAIIEAPDRPAIAQGELEIHDGSYKIYGQKLNIDEGRLLYAASPLTNPGLQFRVVRRQGNVEAGILVFGRLKKPELELFSNPPMDDSDILAYILIGKPLREATTSEGDRVSQAARSLQLAGGTWLAKRLGKELDLEEVSIESGASEDAASLVLGKYLSPRLYVQYIIGLTEGGNILRARYEINKNWVLESESGLHSGVDLLFTLER